MKRGEELTLYRDLDGRLHAFLKKPGEVGSRTLDVDPALAYIAGMIGRLLEQKEVEKA